MNKYYLYQHRRLDTNEVFYIGIGTKSQNDIKRNYYTRSTTKSRRSNFWKNIYNKAGRKVEILLESDSYDFIKQKEIEFVAKLGRADKNLGNLVNHTDGGEGTKGLIVSKETKEKLKLAKIKAYANGYRTKGKPVFQYCGETGKFLKKWEHTIDAANYIKVTKGSIGKTCKGINNNYSKGFFWFYEYKGELINKKKGKIKKFNSKIIMIDKHTDIELFEFDNMELAFKFLQKSHSGVIRRAIKNNSTAYNYKWKEREQMQS